MAAEYRVTPTEWSPRGEAVAMSAKGKPLDVWQGIVGESCMVRLQHRGQHRSAAYYLDAERPHPHRVAPPCPKFVACGGCPLMHLSPEGQWTVRDALVRAALDEQGLDDVQLGQRFECPEGDADYRHVIKVYAGVSDRGHLRVGAWGRRSHRVVPIPECSVTAPVLRNLMKSLAHHVIDLDIRPFDPESGKGVLRTVVARASRTTGEVIVTLVVGRRIRELKELAERLCAENTLVAGVWLHVNVEEGNAIYDRDHRGAIGVRPLSGKATIDEKLGDVTYAIGPGDFFQTNPASAEVLYQATMERLELQQGDAVVDLYCGVGGLALQAARITGWALGIEEVEGAVVRAREAAHRNGITAEFQAEIVVHALPDVAARMQGRAPIITVNPSRSGLEEGVVEGILAMKPRRVAYVSCNPRSLARDLAAFREGGLRIGAVDRFDMFPNTPHVECLVVLEGESPEGGARRAPMRKRVRRR